MDELLEDFLVETREGLSELDNDLVALERNPKDPDIISKIFRVMHTIKGTCGFLGLSRLESIAHKGEDIFDKIRDGELTVTPETISLVFESLDVINSILSHIETHETESQGDDTDLIARLKACAAGGAATPAPQAVTPPPPSPPMEEPVSIHASEKNKVDVIPQDNADLQRIFDETPSLVDVGQYNAAPTTPALTSSGNGDNAALQKLFDETKPLVDMGSPTPPTAPTSTPSPAKAGPAAEHTEGDHDKKAAAHANQTIRVNLDILEDLMQKASELVLTRNQLMQIMRKSTDSSFNAALQRLNSITTELQEGVMKTRMQPVGNAWTKLPRLVRNLAVDLGKKIELKMEGEETELDRHLLEQITDPLTHMVRNSGDHGLETPEKRLAAGKPETGTIELKAYHGGGYIIIEISDDGNGINPEIIRKKAVEKKLTTEADSLAMSEAQILQFIFAPGFSTAAAITSVSGRGVGMDVVKNNIESISGTVDLKSVVGKGSTFTIKIPLTLAIMPILQVASKKQKFAIPQINVMEIVKANKNPAFVIEQIHGKPVLRLRNKLLPLISLSEALKTGNCDYDNDTSPKFVVVCEIGTYHFGVIVDEVFETEEIVVKPVSHLLKGIDIYSGCTILGDGSVILILDPNGLAKTTGEVIAGSRKSSHTRGQALDTVETASFIVFKAGDATPKVIPLELISRLEEVDVSKIEYSHGKPVVQYRGDLMRIVKIDENYEIPKEGIQEMLVLTNNDKIMGLVVENILDIAKCPMDKDLSGGNDGFLGSMVINGKTCDVLDVTYYFDRAFDDLAQEEANPQVSRSPSNTLLLVDDSPFFRKFIPPELKAAGYTVLTAANGQEALTVLGQNRHITAVITDLNMPGMGGNELLAKCKADPTLKHLPFIALSSSIEEDSEKSMEDTDAFDACVSKTNHKALADIVRSVLEKEKVA